MKECFWRISFHRILCWQSRRSKWSMKMLIRIKRFSFEIFLVFPNIFWIFLIPLKISNFLNILWSVIDSFQVLLLGHALKIKAERKISKRSYDIRIVLTQPIWRAPPPQVVGILPRIGWSSPSASQSSSLSSSSGFSSTNFTGSVAISIKLQRLKLQGLKKSLPAISFYCSWLVFYVSFYKSCVSECLSLYSRSHPPLRAAMKRKKCLCQVWQPRGRCCQSS